MITCISKKDFISIKETEKLTTENKVIIKSRLEKKKTDMFQDKPQINTEKCDKEGKFTIVK